MGDNITKERWTKIFTATIERFSKEIKKSFLRIRLLGVFLIAFYKNFLVSQEILLQLNALGLVVKDILDRLSEFGHVYDRKVTNLCQHI